MKAAQAEDSAVRMQAIRALATVGNETAVPLLLEVGQNPTRSLPKLLDRYLQHFRLVESTQRFLVDLRAMTSLPNEWLLM